MFDRDALSPTPKLGQPTQSQPCKAFVASSPSPHGRHLVTRRVVAKTKSMPYSNCGRRTCSKRGCKHGAISLQTNSRLRISSIAVHLRVGFRVPGSQPLHDRRGWQRFRLRTVAGSSLDPSRAKPHFGALLIRGLTLSARDTAAMPPAWTPFFALRTQRLFLGSCRSIECLFVVIVRRLAPTGRPTSPLNLSNPSERCHAEGTPKLAQMSCSSGEPESAHHLMRSHTPPSAGHRGRLYNLIRQRATINPASGTLATASPVLAHFIVASSGPTSHCSRRAGLTLASHGARRSLRSPLLGHHAHAHFISAITRLIGAHGRASPPHGVTMHPPFTAPRLVDSLVPVDP